jgi:hypothetical protein
MAGRPFRGYTARTMVNLLPRERERLLAAAEAQDLTCSQYLRRLVRRALDTEGTKAINDRQRAELSPASPA